MSLETNNIDSEAKSIFIECNFMKIIEQFLALNEINIIISHQCEEWLRLSDYSPAPQLNGQITYSPQSHNCTIMGGHNFMGGYNGKDSNG